MFLDLFSGHDGMLELIRDSTRGERERLKIAVGQGRGSSVHSLNNDAGSGHSAMIRQRTVQIQGQSLLVAFHKTQKM